MNKLFCFVLSCFLAVSLAAQNPVSINTIKNCISNDALNDFKNLKGEHLYGTQANENSKYYWSRFKLLYQLGSDSSFVFYCSPYDRHNLEFFYDFDSDSEESILKIVNKVIEYFVTKRKWTKKDELNDAYNGLQLRDENNNIRLKFSSNSKENISLLQIFSIKTE